MFKVHHIAISVSNIEKSEKFYSLFGFKKIFYFMSDDKNLEIAHLKLDDFILEFFCFRNHKKLQETEKEISTSLPQIGVKHFGIKVDNLEKIKDIFEKNNIAEDIKITVGRTKIKYFFVKDPDGILLEFVEDKRKF